MVQVDGYFALVPSITRLYLITVCTNSGSTDKQVPYLQSAVRSTVRSGGGMARLAYLLLRTLASQIDYHGSLTFSLVDKHKSRPTIQLDGPKVIRFNSKPDFLKTQGPGLVQGHGSQSFA